jgi:hypothetical protein
LRHLVRIYPKAWRRRYGAELTDFLEQRRATLAQVVDVLRGALRAHAEPHLAERLVFVPDFGFRPSGTRVLPTRVATTLDRTTLAIVSAAASAEETELLVEWDPPDESGPDSWMVKIDRSGVHQRPPMELDASLIVAGARTAPLHVEHRLRSASGYNLRALTFPALPAGISAAELRVCQGPHEWRLPFTLDSSAFIGEPAGLAIEHESVTIRVTAVARSRDQIAVALEARARGARVSTMGTGGGPTTFQKHLKSQRKPAYPLVLEDDQGRRGEELSRMAQLPREPETTVDGSWPLRITSVFAWPHSDAMAVVLIVPCVVVAENTEAATIDLRTLPADIQLGPYPIHVVRTEVSPDNRPRTRIVLDLPGLPGSRHLLGPGHVVAQGMPTDLSQHGVPDAQRRMWIDTVVLEEPVVTATTALVRVDGPWRLPLST